MKLKIVIINNMDTRYYMDTTIQELEMEKQ